MRTFPPYPSPSLWEIFWKITRFNFVNYICGTLLKFTVLVRYIHDINLLGGLMLSVAITSLTLNYPIKLHLYKRQAVK